MDGGDGVIHWGWVHGSGKFGKEGRRTHDESSFGVGEFVGLPVSVWLMVESWKESSRDRNLSVLSTSIGTEAIGRDEITWGECVEGEDSWKQHSEKPHSKGWLQGENPEKMVSRGQRWMTCDTETQGETRSTRRGWSLWSDMDRYQARWEPKVSEASPSPALNTSPYLYLLPGWSPYIPCVQLPTWTLPVDVWLLKLLTSKTELLIFTTCSSSWISSPITVPLSHSTKTTLSLLSFRVQQLPTRLSPKDFCHNIQYLCSLLPDLFRGEFFYFLQFPAQLSLIREPLLHHPVWNAAILHCLLSQLYFLCCTSHFLKNLPIYLIIVCCPQVGCKSRNFVLFTSISLVSIIVLGTW